MQDISSQGGAPGSEDRQGQQQQQPQDDGGSGEGSASAFRRMNEQRERHDKSRPGDERSIRK